MSRDHTLPPVDTPFSQFERELMSQLFSTMIHRMDRLEHRMDRMSQNSDALAAAVADLTGVVGGVLDAIDKLKAPPVSDGVDEQLPAITDAVKKAAADLSAAIAPST